MKSVAVAVTFAFTSLAAAGCASSTADQVSESDSLLRASPRHDRCLATAAANQVTSVQFHTSAVNYPALTGLSGVQVCTQTLDGTSTQSCVQTGADGKVSIPVAPCQDVRVTYSVAGYLGVNQVDAIDSSDLTFGTRMLTTTQAQQLAGAVGATYDPTKALPIITTYSASHAPLAGVAIGGSIADRGTEWYLSATGVPKTSLTETSSVGIMGFTNVAIGTGQVTATADGKTCVPFVSVPGDAANSAVIEAMPGSISEAAFTCD